MADPSPVFTVTVNRKPVTIERARTLFELVEELGLPTHRIAIAKNGTVIVRDRWPSVNLEPGDQIDVVRAVSGGAASADDVFTIADRRFTSRLIVGTGRFPSPEILRQSLIAAGTEMVTVSIRAMGLDGQAASNGILDELDLTRYCLLPNTAGAVSVRQAVFMAQLAREATGTNWIKLEVIGDERSLWPDPTGTVEACRILVSEDFVVLPYTSLDLVTALRLEQAGAAAVMPLAAMIGSGQGVQDPKSVRRIVERVRCPVIVDAGIGTASDAAIAMEQGAAACLVNTAISRAQDPVKMARAMRLAVEAGRLAYLAGRIPRLDIAVPSSPLDGVVTTEREPVITTPREGSEYGKRE